MTPDGLRMTRKGCSTDDAEVIASLEEMDRAPIEPCPVCLKMLQYNLRFDIRTRYRRLMAIYERNELGKQRDWIQERLERIGCG